MLRLNVGAQEVIKQILARRSVTKLILGHNDLGDSGCEELFGFLNSDAGRNYKITHISLNSNGIGNRGLLAISRYLRDNTSLKELFLQNVSSTHCTPRWGLSPQKSWAITSRRIS